MENERISNCDFLVVSRQISHNINNMDKIFLKCCQSAAMPRSSIIQNVFQRMVLMVNKIIIIDFKRGNLISADALFLSFKYSDI